MTNNTSFDDDIFEGMVQRLCELAYWQCFHDTCAFGRCRRVGQCLWNKAKPLRTMNAEDRAFYDAGAPFCVAAMGARKREDVLKLAWTGYYDNLCLDKEREPKRQRRLRQRRVRQRASSAARSG